MGRHRMWAPKMTMWEWQRREQDRKDSEARAVRAETERDEMKKAWQNLIKSLEILTKLSDPTSKLNEPLQLVQKIQEAGH
jgi:hypothetical protein